MHAVRIYIICLVTAFASVTNAQNLTNDQKFEVINEVYTRIYTAMGLNEDKPQLIFDANRARSVAYLKKNKDGSKALAVESKAFDICMSFGDRGKAALALLIGHELGHFRYNHHWGKDFASSFALSDIEESIEEANSKLSELKFYETQADQSGGVYCYLAGYDIGGLAEPLLKKIYKDYGLSEAMAKYPSLTQRIAIAQQNDSAVKQAIRVYETGTFALIAGNYDEAQRCLDFAINKGFKSREVYNNAGVAFLLSAMDKIGKDNVKYAYPVEIDVEARIKQTTKGFSKEVEGMITRAKELFKLAIDLDPEYSTGYINLACVYSLKKEFDDATYMANKAKKIVETGNDANGISKTLVVLGILQDQQGNAGKAKDLFKEAIEKNESYLAEANLAIVNGKTIADMRWAKKLVRENIKETGDEVEPAALAKESIDGVSDFAAEAENLELEEITMHNGSCFYADKGTSVIYNITTTGGKELFFHKTAKTYTGTTSKGIKVGDDIKMVFKKYGFPEAVYNSQRETMLVFKAPGLIVLTENNKVSSWIHYGF